MGKNELDFKWHQIQTGNIYFGSQKSSPFFFFPPWLFFLDWACCLKALE